jgi:16S rRNA (guanine966-N2)-methyltransferase
MKKGQVKIIAGQWRGRKLSFPAIAGLRPTPNRIRETLFNWVEPLLAEAHCLDLFAGSGALGFEAISRGARSVTFIEQSWLLVNYLKEQIKQLAITDKANVYHLSFPFNTSALKRHAHPNFNLIFIDPPFHKNLIELTCFWLLKENLLSSKSMLYLEMEASLKEFPLPKNWHINRCKTAGQVKYMLIQTTP